MSQTLLSVPVSGLFQVPFASLGLYFSDLNGNPLSPAAWLAKGTETLRVSDNFIERLSRPTASRYANTHHLDEQHIIEIGGFMDLSFVMQRNQQFVLFVTWQASDVGVPILQNPSPIYWTRTYYGVTFINLDNAGRAGDPFGMVQRLRAQFYQQATGTGSPPGPLTAP